MRQLHFGRLAAPNVQVDAWAGRQLLRMKRPRQCSTDYDKSNKVRADTANSLSQACQTWSRGTVELIFRVAREELPY